jgi:LAO/AO transport system kinase
MDTGKLRANMGSETNFADAARKMGSDTNIPDPASPGGQSASKKSVSDPAWRPPVIATSSLRDQGIDELLDAIDRHRESLQHSGEIDARRATIAERRLLAAGEAILRDTFARHRNGRLAPLLEQLRERTLSPHTAARKLLRELHIGDD